MTFFENAVLRCDEQYYIDHTNTTFDKELDKIKINDFDSYLIFLISPISMICCILLVITFLKSRKFRDSTG